MRNGGSIARHWAVWTAAAAAVAVTAFVPAWSADDEPTVTVVGAQNNALTITSTGPGLDTLVTLRATGSPADVAVAVGAFRDPNGETFLATVDNATPTFTYGFAAVRVTAPLPFGGPFTADLAIVVAGTPNVPVTLTVTRARPATPVTVDSVKTSSTTSWGLEAQSTGKAVTITETSGREVVLDPPKVVKPSRNRGGETVDARIRVTGVSTSENADACTVDDRTTVTIQPGRSCRLWLTFEVPASAGSYDGSLRFAAPGFIPVDDPLAIGLRRHWLVAVVFIGFGVALAVLVTKVWKGQRDEVDAHIAVANAREDLDAGVRRLPDGGRDSDERALVAGLHAVLDTVDREVEDKQLNDAKAHLEIARKQIAALGGWVRLHRALLAADPAVRDALATEWRELTAMVTDPSLGDDRAGTLLSQLEKLRKELDAKSREAIGLQASLLARQLPTLGLAGADKALIETLVDQAKSEASNASIAYDRLVRAQSAAADALAERIENFIGREARDLGLDETTPEWWASFRLSILDQVVRARTAGPEERVAVLRRADAALVGGVASQFRRVLQGQHDVAVADPAPGAQERAKLLKPILAELSKAVTAAGTTDVTEAYRAYAAATDAYAAAKRTTHMAPGADLRLAPLPGGVLGAAPRPVVSGDQITGTHVRGDRAQLVRKREAIENALLVAAVIVAVLAGLLALYSGKPTWGSLGDVVAAILWGLGVSAAGSGVAGFAGVYQTLRA